METLWNKNNNDGNSFLVNNEILSDCKFIFSNADEINAHTFLLSKKSPVFYTMFYGSLREGITVKIEDSSQTSFLELVKYIYIEIVDFTVENVIEIKYLAKKYLIKRLQEECEEFVDKNIAVVNVLGILEGSIYFKCEMIEKKCVVFMENHTVEIMSQENFLKTNIEMITYFVTLETKNCNEITFFHLTIRWAENYCNTNNIQLISLKELFRLIRFSTMNVEEFAECMKYKTLFTNEEIGKIFLNITKTTNRASSSKSNCLNFKAVPFRYSNAIIDLLSYTDAITALNINNPDKSYIQLTKKQCFIKLTILKNCSLTKIEFNFTKPNINLKTCLKITDQKKRLIVYTGQPTNIITNGCLSNLNNIPLLVKGSTYRIEFNPPILNYNVNGDDGSPLGLNLNNRTLGSLNIKNVLRVKNTQQNIIKKLHFNVPIKEL